MPGDKSGRLAVLDASVAIRWLVPEDGSADAVALMNEGYSWIAPRLIISEIAATLRRKVVADGMRVADAIQAIDAFKMAISSNVVELARDEELIPEALALALSIGHKLPDCLYLALAERDGAALATADKSLSRIASMREVAVLFIPRA